MQIRVSRFGLRGQPPSNGFDSWYLMFFLISKTSVLQENEEKEFVSFGLDEYQSSDSGCELQGYFRKSQSANTLSKRKQLVGKYERSSNAQ